MKLLLISIFTLVLTSGYAQTYNTVYKATSIDLENDQTENKLLLSETGENNSLGGCQASVYEQVLSLCYGENIRVGDHVYYVSGIYRDTLINSNQCDSIVTTYLTVNEPLITFQDIFICEGEAYEIGDSSYSISGTYTNLLTSAIGCDSAVLTYLEVLPKIDASILIHNNFTLQALTPYYDTLSYQWIDCNESHAINHENSPVFTPKENGNYALVVSNSMCTDTSDNIQISTLGNSPFNPTMVNIYPNPATDYITIDFDDLTFEQMDIQIYNTTGMLMYQTQTTARQLTILLDQFSSGIYTLQMSNGKEKHTAIFNVQ